MFSELLSSWRKGAGHRYIRRKPYLDKKGRKRYRYTYQAQRGGGVTSSEAMVEGSAYKLTHKGKAGHFHIQSVSGDKLKIRHDESGGELELTKAEFQRLLNIEHGEALGRAADRAEATLKQAKKTGSAKQIKRAEAEARKMREIAERGKEPAPEPKAPAPGGLVDLHEEADRLLHGEFKGREWERNSEWGWKTDSEGNRIYTKQAQDRFNEILNKLSDEREDTSPAAISKMRSEIERLETKIAEMGEYNRKVREGEISSGGYSFEVVEERKATLKEKRERLVGALKEQIEQTSEPDAADLVRERERVLKDLKRAEEAQKRQLREELEKRAVYGDEIQNLELKMSEATDQRERLDYKRKLDSSQDGLWWVNRRIDFIKDPLRREHHKRKRADEEALVKVESEAPEPAPEPKAKEPEPKTGALKQEAAELEDLEVKIRDQALPPQTKKRALDSVRDQRLKVAAQLGELRAKEEGGESSEGAPSTLYRLPGGGRVEIRQDQDDNRIRLFFPGKPSDDQRARLKKRGFRWSPRAGAWQRQLTENAVIASGSVLRAMGAELVKEAP